MRTLCLALVALLVIGALGVPLPSAVAASGGSAPARGAASERSGSEHSGPEHSDPVMVSGREIDPVGAWPLRPEPEVVQGFDPPASRYGAGHRGVDLATRAGASVHAALPGVVTFAARIAGRGVVVVSHGDTRTTYEPVTASVSVGDVVALGAVLGAVEYAGSHCRPRVCLHWGWLRGETYLNPLRLVGAGPVRLVPWGGLDAGSNPARRPWVGVLRGIRPW